MVLILRDAGKKWLVNMGRMTEFRSGKKVGHPWLKHLAGALLALVIAGGGLVGGVAGGHWLHRLRWIDGDLNRGLSVARREHRKVLLLITADW